MKKRPIGSEEALRGFIALHPSFIECWKQAQCDDPPEIAPRMVYGYFGMKIRALIEEDSTTDCTAILRYAETLARDGTEEVKDLALVYFIETLLNASDALPFPMAPVLRALGPVSRAYALGYNKHFGHQNLGLEIEPSALPCRIVRDDPE